jgi:hypothetical protein
MKLSRPQVAALRYVRGRMLFASDVDAGNGNMRRSIMTLFKLGMLAWDPIYTTRIVLTKTGKEALEDIAVRLPVVAKYLRAKHHTEAARTIAQQLKWKAEAFRLFASMTATERQAAEAKETSP